MDQLAARIRELCKLHWGGNIQRMAKDLGVSHAVAWRVMEDGQSPPGKMIEALASDPRVNLTWLFRGEGKPTDPLPGRGIAIPIAKQVLRGPPQDHQDCLSGETFALAANLCRPGRYWAEVQPGDPVLRSGLRPCPRFVARGRRSSVVSVAGATGTSPLWRGRRW